MEKSEKQIEIAPGLTTEQMTALFFDKDALTEPAYRLHQLNQAGHRYYYRFDEEGHAKFYPSVTTLLGQTMPTSPFLIDWMLENGKEGAAEKRDLAAAYGSFMHSQFETLLINRTYNFDDVPEVLGAYLERNNLPDKVFAEWADKIRKDVLAFAAFLREWRVKPLAVEVALYSKRGYAGMIDLTCLMIDPNTCEPFPAIVDFKSGRKGFWEGHEIQLHLYVPMWNENFPALPIERCFNFAPKDWRKRPNYTLKEQTNSVNAAKVEPLLQLAAIEDEKRENTISIVRGSVSLDDGELMDNVLQLSLSDFIESKREEIEPAEGVEL